MFFRSMRFGELIDGIYRSLRKSFWSIWWFLFLINMPFLSLIIGGYYWTNDQSSLIILIIFMIGVYLFILFPVFQNGCAQIVMRQLQQAEEQLQSFSLFPIAFKNIWCIWAVNGLLVGLLIIVGLLITMIVGLPILTLYTSNGTPWQGAIFPSFVISAIACFFPISYLWIRLSLALPIVSIELVPFREAFVRSWKLTHRAYLALCGKWFTVVLLQLPILFVGIFFANPFVAPELFSIVFYLLISPIIFALGAILFSFIYVDQRVRKEAFDLHMNMMDRGEA